MTLSGYRAAGGVEGAIAHTAEETLSRLSAGQITVARELFLNLTELGEGSEDTRRIASREELLAGADAGTLDSVLETLVRARLITTSKGEVEVAHEALIRRWPTLKEWLADNRERLRFERQMARDAADWEQSGCDPDILYRGSRLAQAQENIAQLQGKLPPLSQRFIEASSAEQQREIVEKETRERQKLEQERALAEAQRQRAEEAEKATVKQKRLTRIAFAVGGVALLLFFVAGIAGIWATNSAEKARANEALAETRQSEAITSADLAATREAEANESAILAATSEANAVTSADLAATREAEAIESAALAATSEAVAVANADLAAIREAEAQRQARLALAQSLTALSPLAYQRTADSELAALLAIEAHNINREEGGSIDWLVDGGLRPVIAQAPPYFSNILEDHESQVLSVAFSPDGQTLASGSSDSTIRLWDLGEPTAAPVVLSGHEDEVWSVAFSPDGQTLASGSEDRTIRLWILLDEMVEIGCQKVRRNLSWQEWQQYVPREPYRATCPHLPPHSSVPPESLPES